MSMQRNTVPLSGVLPLVADGGGRGGSVLSLRSEEEKEVLSLPPPQREEGTTLASTLLALGVFILAPAKLRATAASLAAVGVEPQQLLDLAQFIAEAEDDAGKQRKYLASVLVDTARTQEALANVARHKAARAKVAEGPAHFQNMPIGSVACSCNACVAKRAEAAAEPWDHDRQCRVAYCLHHSDRRTTAQLADFFGVSESTAKLMVERGRVVSRSAYEESLGAAPNMKKVGRDEEAAKERLRRFRESTRGERLRLLKGDA